MSQYRRSRAAGGTFFFTVALARRDEPFLTRHIDPLRAAYVSAARRMPFDTIAVCILPDHLHAVWRLPAADADFSSRWRLIKSDFSRGLPPSPDRSASKQAE